MNLRFFLLLGGFFVWLFFFFLWLSPTHQLVLFSSVLEKTENKHPKFTFYMSLTTEQLSAIPPKVIPFPGWKILWFNVPWTERVPYLIIPHVLHRETLMLWTNRHKIPAITLYLSTECTLNETWAVWSQILWVGRAVKSQQPGRNKWNCAQSSPGRLPPGFPEHKAASPAHPECQATAIKLCRR